MKQWMLLTAFVPTLAFARPQEGDNASTPWQAQRQTLHEARQAYRDSVRAYGADSAQAAKARDQLRESRREFHRARRASQESSR